MEVSVKNSQGDTVETIDLDDAVFAVPMNHALVHQALVIYQGNKRQGTADTKTRAQVSGGGRKPWIQKPFPYQGKCLRWLREARDELSPSDSAEVDGLLKGSGCEALFL